MRSHWDLEDDNDADGSGSLCTTGNPGYILTTGCTWHDVPAKYGTKSTVHRYHLELCEKGVYQAIFLDLLRSGCGLQKIDLSHCATDTKDIPAKKGINRL